MELMTRLRNALDTVKDPYPGFATGIINQTGYMTDEDLEALISAIENDPDISSGKVTELSSKYAFGERNKPWEVRVKNGRFIRYGSDIWETL